jgi:MASE9 protein
MSTAAKIYVSSVIAMGGAVLLLALSQWSSANPVHFFIFLALAMGASLIKLRLPGVDGTYSLSFFFVLIGIAHFSLPETLVAACAAALVGTIFTREERPTLVQVLFNDGNLIVSIGACYLAASTLFAAGPDAFRPAALALVAFLYFVVNTVLVSGVLSLLQGKGLFSVWEEWYVWSFPYYLVGVAVVGLLPLSGLSVSPAAWVIVLPVLYLVHFYHGLSVELGPQEKPKPSENVEFRLPTPAKVYVGLVIAAGIALLGWGLFTWESDSGWRFLAFLGLTLVTSAWKVWLPKMTGTISVNFVVMLAAIAELSLPEVMLLAVAATVVQSLWKPEQKPIVVQMLFNVATLVITSSLAYGAFHGLQTSTSGGSLAFVLFIATSVLYCGNTILVSVAVRLAESLPFSEVWQRCCFWSFPYYVVGAVFAGLMVVTSSSAGWPISFLVVPLMALVYVSYSIHVGKLGKAVPAAAQRV